MLAADQLQDHRQKAIRRCAIGKFDDLVENRLAIGIEPRIAFALPLSPESGIWRCPGANTRRVGAGTRRRTPFRHLGLPGRQWTERFPPGWSLAGGPDARAHPRLDVVFVPADCHRAELNALRKSAGLFFPPDRCVAVPGAS